MIVNIAGPGGAGKNTLVQALRSQDPLRFTVLVPSTTRKMRPGEVNGRDYHFVTADVLANDDIYTLKRVRGSAVYAVRKTDLETGSQVLLTTFPPSGVVKLRQLGHEVVCLYLELDEEERARRMLARGDKPEDIAERLRIDRLECSLVLTHAVLGDRGVFVLDALKPTPDLVAEVVSILEGCFK